jgi:hypothetical protein
VLVVICANAETKDNNRNPEGNYCGVFDSAVLTIDVHQESDLKHVCAFIN